MSGGEHISREIDGLIEAARDCPIPVVVVNLDAKIPMRTQHTIDVDVPVHPGGWQRRRESWQYDLYLDLHRKRRVFIPRRV